MDNYGNDMSGGGITAKPNVVLGIIGALVGALLGVAIWIGLYQLGVIASFAGVAISYFACFGYGLLSKSKALKGVIISVVISVLLLLAAHFFCWGLEIYNAFKAEYDITLMDAMRSLPAIVFETELMIDFVKELLIGLILIGVGSVQFFRKARQNGAV